MGADVDDRARKIGIGHPGHGDQELAIEKPRSAPIFQSR